MPPKPSETQASPNQLRKMFDLGGTHRPAASFPGGEPAAAA